MQEHKLMGVINITPNSFSDTRDNSLKDNFKKKLEDVISWADIIDLGAESTAPFNAKIEAEEELTRFIKAFRPCLISIKDPRKVISIDTYKVSVFEKIASEISQYWPESKIIFNDVSGTVDQELIEFFQRTQLRFDYVLAHNNVDQRSNTSSHMDFCTKTDGDDFLESVIEKLQTELRKLPAPRGRVILDPCFGFSKTREQNLYLLKNLKKIIKHFPDDTCFLFGISRKSFIRVPQELNAKENADVLDHMQTYFMAQIMKLSKRAIFRTHSKNSYIAARKILLLQREMD